jgi:Zn-dependent protease
MDNTDHHVGFHQEAPEKVVWSESSFIRPVHPGDQRNIRKVCAGYYIGIIALFVLSCVVFFLDMLIGKYFPDLHLPKIINVLPAFFLIPAVLLSLMAKFFLKKVTIRNIESRGELLFQPDRGCIFVGIESAFTYDKRKLTADDFGLLRLEPGILQMEMEKYRAQFDLADMRVSLLHTGKNIAGVLLSLNHDLWPWSVVFTPLENLGGSIGIGNVGKSKRLLEMLINAGARSEETPAVTKTFVSTTVHDVAGAEQMPSQAQPLKADSGEHTDADIADHRYRNILEAIRKKQQKQKKGYLKNIAILAITLFIFFQLGFFHWGLRAVLLILLVLFVHEMGHFLGMKMFGYKNVQMFFIPLLGAAVSGHSQNIPAWKKATVFLFGPLPGICISVVMFLTYFITAQELCLQMGSMFLIINIINLLPIYPLDGGQFLHQVLFSRNRYLELVVNIVTAAVLLLAGVALKSWLLEILGFINLLGITFKFKMASAARQLKASLLTTNIQDTEHASLDVYEEDIPEHIMKRMIDWIYSNMPAGMTPKTVAATVLQLWERVRVDPPGAGATAALLVTFFAGYVISFLSLGILAASFYRNFMVSSEIVEYQDPNGVTCYKEQSYFMGELSTETQLTDDRMYYHGYHKGYGIGGGIVEEGQWDMGSRTGTWKIYDANDVLTGETLYENGKPVLIKRLVEGRWTETKWEDFSQQTRNFHEQTAQFRFGPGKSPEYDYSDFVYDPNNL